MQLDICSCKNNFFINYPPGKKHEYSIVGRGVEPSYFMKTPITLPTLPPFFKFYPTLPHPSSFLSPPTSTLAALSVSLFLWLNRRLYHICCVILLHYIIDLNMSSLTRHWCVFYAVFYASLLRSDIHVFLLVLWFDITHTRHKEHALLFILSLALYFTSIKLYKNKIYYKVRYSYKKLDKNQAHLQKASLLHRI